MTFDETLATRVRPALAETTPAGERRMFGGLAFMVNAHLACGIRRDDLMVRVGSEGHDAALALGAREMDLTGRPMRGMVVVPGDRVASDEHLDLWVERAVSFARSLPPRPPTTPARRPAPGAEPRGPGRETGG